MTVENELKRKKESLKFFYQMAQEALDAKDLEQAIKISAKGLEEAELENQSEWAEKFDALNSKVEFAKEHPTLNPSLTREDITVIKGVGAAVAEKLKRAGFNTVKLIADTTFPQLTIIPGIGQKIAQKIIESANIHISRKSLNDYPGENNGKKEPPVKSEIKQSLKIDKLQKLSPVKTNVPWFEDKFKIKRSGVSQSTTVDYNQECILEEVDDGSEYKMDDDTLEHEEEITSEITHENIFRDTDVQEDFNHTSIHNETKQTQVIQEELQPSEKKSAIEGLIHTFRGLDFHIIEKVRLLKDLSMNSDLIALKIIHANEFLDLVLILPLKLNVLKGELKISNEQVKYIPLNEKFNENGSSFRLLLDSTINNLGEVYNAMRADLVNEGKLLSYLRKHLQVDISIEKSITKKNLFFRVGPLQYKILIDPILVCKNEIGFLEKLLPFPYLKDINLHMINERRLPSFLTYLEKKYTLLEDYTGQDCSLVSYEDSFNQFLHNGKKLSLPFIGFGFILLMFVLFQFFFILELVINIGYALLGVYLTSLAYLYIKFFKIKMESQTEFEIPCHQKQIQIDDPGLILINDEFTPELMDQFVFECLGKDYNSPFIQKIEEAHTKKRLDEKVRTANIKSEHLFEEREAENESENVGEHFSEDIQEDDDIIHKYSSFLED